MGWGENDQVRTPVTSAGLRRYDKLTATQAATQAWHVPGPNPAHHRRAIAQVRAAMPVLARALDRLLPTRTPYITHEQVVTRLMAAFDVQFPYASAGLRGAVEREYHKTLDALNEQHMVIAERVE